MKIKYLSNIAVIGLFLLIGSCRKVNQKYITKADGVVRNKVTGEEVKGIPIQIIGCKFIGPSTKCLENIQTTLTDENGYYNMTVESNKWQQYKIAVGNNNILGGTPYPYYPELTTGKSNTTNFSQFPIKKLKAHITIQRHNRNWLDLRVHNTDSYDFFSNDLYNGSNPTSDFDNTYIFNIEAGRQYEIVAILSDRTAPYTNINQEYFSKLFSVNNNDTTVVNFIVQ